RAGRPRRAHGGAGGAQHPGGAVPPGQDAVLARERGGLMAELALGRVGRVERPLRHFDLTLLFAAVALSVVGVFMQYASDRATLIQLGEDPAATAKKQLAWLMLSALVMILVIAFD